MTAQVPHILVVGGGYVGMYTAYGLRRAARKGKIRVTVVDPRSVMTYQPFLPEAAAGSVEPRHVVVPLRKTLKGCRVVTGRVTGIDHENKVAKVMPEEGPEYELAYDQVVVALGSIARTLPIPGLAEEATGFKNVEEAIALRNKVLDRLDVASSQPDPALRKSALTFVFVGGGYAGVEAFAELEDMARYATRYYDNINPDDMRWVLVEATGRILPEVGDGRVVTGGPGVVHALDPQVRQALDPAALVQREVGRRERRVRLHAGRPDDRVGVELLAVAEDHVTLLAGLQPGLQLDVHVPLAELVDGVPAELLADLRQDPAGRLHQHPAHVVRVDVVVVPGGVAGHVLELRERLDTGVPAADEDEGQRGLAQRRVGL